MNRSIATCAILLWASLVSPIAASEPLPPRQQQQLARWDALERLPKLQRLEIAGPAAKANAAPIERLLARRPEVTVSDRLTRSRNYDGL